ncbi:MAG TPA: HAMP domain-containing sensor histidine kinase [Kofleriaceae bacterium]
MLTEFIETHRALILARARERLLSRAIPRPTERELQHGVPIFLDQLSARLRSGLEADTAPIGTSASLHGGELQKLGFTIGQVVHGYGDVCQTITELAVERATQISNEDFRTLNLCLDTAIAEAVTEYARQREHTIAEQGVEHLGFLAHELRNLLSAASLAFETAKSGRLDLSGRTGSLLSKSLVGMHDLVTRSLAEVRLESGAPRRERISLTAVLEEIEITATAQCRRRDVQLSIEPAAPDIKFEGDFQLVASIITNLIQNACKYTRAHGGVMLRTCVVSDRVLIDVADECGGLPPGKADELFRPYEQRSSDRSGLGLGLAISLKAAKAMGGTIHVRNVPGTGCVFTLDLTRAST